MIISFGWLLYLLFWWLCWKAETQQYPTCSRVIMLRPKSAVYVSPSCHILDRDPQQKQESIFNIFGIGSHTAVNTGHGSQVWHCVYCKHSLQKHPLSSAVTKAPGQWHFHPSLPLENAFFRSQDSIPNMLKLILGSWDIFVSTPLIKSTRMCVCVVCMSFCTDTKF